jgi:hypothetical protein
MSVLVSKDGAVLIRDGGRDGSIEDMISSSSHLSKYEGSSQRSGDNESILSMSMSLSSSCVIRAVALVEAVENGVDSDG